MPTTFSIHGPVLEAMLHFTADPRGAASASITTDVLIEMTEASLRFVATNAQMLGILHLTAMNGYGMTITCETPQRIVVPVQALTPILRDHRYPHIQVTVDGLSITVSNASGTRTTVTGRTPDTFPVYQHFLPQGPAQPVTGLSFDTTLLGRFTAFAKALRLEPTLSVGFYGHDRLCSVRLPQCSAFYGAFIPSPQEHADAVPTWLTQPTDWSVAMPASSQESLIETPMLPIITSTPSPVTPEIPGSSLPVLPSPMADLMVGQKVLYQGQAYSICKVDGEWIDLDTSTVEKKSWRTVRRSLLGDVQEMEALPVSMPSQTPSVSLLASEHTPTPCGEMIGTRQHPYEDPPVLAPPCLPDAPVPMTPSLDSVSLAKAWYQHLQDGGNLASKREMHLHLAGLLGVELSAITEAIRRLVIDPRVLEEAYEYALVLQARALARDASLSHDEKFRQFLKQYDRQIAVSQRDTVVTAHQQYSTPLPLCYLIGRYLGLDQDGYFYEPTAGNGSLLITADPAQVIVNELAVGPRLAALDDQGFKRVLNADALTIPQDHRDLIRQMDAVVMNPPFQTLTTAVQYQGYRITKLEHLIALRSLELLKDEGRAALIIGGHNFFDRFGRARVALPACDTVFFNYLYGYYHVVKNIDIAGELYRKQGTTFPVRLLLIEGRQAIPIDGYAAPCDPSQVQQAQTWEEVDRLLIPPTRKTRELACLPTLPPQSQEATPRLEHTGGTLSTPLSANNDRRQDHAPMRITGSLPHGAPKGTGHTETPASRTPALDAQAKGVQGTDSMDAAQPVAMSNQREPVERKERRSSPQVNTYQATYHPFSHHPGAVEYLSPKNLTEPQRTALEQLTAQHGSVDTYVQHALGYTTLDAVYQAFHAAQIDGIALALSNLSHSGGMILGDGTGVGKGREAAAILAWAKRQGHFPIFFTQNPKLFSDIYSDLQDIGQPMTPYIMNHGADAHIVDTQGKIRVRATGSKEQYRQIANLGVEAPALQGSELLVVNYPQINTENAQRQALLRLAEGNIIVLDESHQASGDSGTGQFIRDQLLPLARGVLYLSATYAKRPNTMPLYYRTDLGNAGLSLPQLIGAIEQGGVALQQVIATDLAKAGQYLRREMDFSQVEYYRTVIDFAHEARDSARSDQVTEILREIVQYDQVKAEQVGAMHQQARQEGKALGKIDGTNRTAAGVSSTTFTATVHNIIGQMLLAIKADAVVDRAIAVLQHPDPSQRKKVVIGLMNTLESHLKALIEAGDLTVGQPVGDYTFTEVLKKALRHTLRYRVKDHTGNATAYQFAVPGVRLTGTQMGMPLDPVSEELFYALMAKIEGMAIDLPGSPIDAMLHRLRAAGVRVGELTGRTYTFNEEGVLTVRAGSEKNKNTLVNAFNRGDLDVLIINASGATGLSIHASPKFEDQRPRVMLVPQSQLNIDTELQLYGRINRTGQVNGPAFEILQTALPSEIRPAAILQGKMASINANTSANEDSHFSLKEIPDMMNKYGDEIVETYLRENPEIALMIGNPERGEGTERGEFFRKVSGRMALAPVAIQRAFYEVVEQRYQRTIAYLDQMGTNDLVTKNYDFAAKTRFRLTIQQGTDESNPFKSSVYVEEVSAKVLAKP